MASNLVLNELMLFAAVGFLIGAIDELIIDIIWIGRRIWRRIFIFSRYKEATVAALAPSPCPGRLAVFIGAWDESSVIKPMLAHLITAFGTADYHVFVGCYPNDIETQAAVRSVSAAAITVAVNDRDGPTSKADSLNLLWRTMLNFERDVGQQFKAIVLHDAEDVVHRAEPVLYDVLIDRFDLVQLPVHPLPDPKSRWVSGHYCDEFAEAHAKALVVREAIGAAVPAAGVGCALSRAIVQRIADQRADKPFDPHSLTEDYEIGLHVKALGGKTALIRIRETTNGPFVAVRAHFPATIATSVRQKTRWIIGIALAGWDRIGWDERWVENWMRLRDRRAPIAALILLAGYGACMLFVILMAMSQLTGSPLPDVKSPVGWLIFLNALFLLWRLFIRVTIVAHQYCWREGLRSIPRMIVGNIISIMAARRALVIYLRSNSAQPIIWDKTDHHFPTSTL